MEHEITIADFLSLQDREDIVLVDIRDEVACSYGMLRGAVAYSADELASMADVFQGRKVVVYCARGLASCEVASRLQDTGVTAYSLQGGYSAFLLEEMKRREQEDLLEQRRQIEKSIHKTFHKSLEVPFSKALNEYDLIHPGDVICVCISGGKDSMLMAKLFQDVKRHNKIPFEVKFLVMDPGYSPANRMAIEHNAKLLGIPITIFESDIFKTVYDIEKNPCYLCARMRRGNLYAKAKEMGCNKIALGHHYDDVIETILMGMLWGGQMQSMMPKLHSQNFEGMELIRPMYLIREADIIRWRDHNNLHFIQCACRFTDTCTTCDRDGHAVSKRMEIKHLIAAMKKDNPSVEANIFRSAENVMLDTLVCYKDKTGRHHFLDGYDKKEKSPEE